MPNRIPIYVDDPADLLNAGEYGTGAVIAIQSSATEGGVYAALSGTGSTPTIALDADTYAYTGRDPSGTSTTWYRTRYENSGATRTSDWTTAFQVGTRTAYADVEDLVELLPTSTVARDHNKLSDALTRASAVIDARCGRQFYRSPQVSGTETRYFTTTDSNRLIVPMGIVSLTEVAYSTSEGGTYTALGAENTDWYLGPDPETGDSYYEVVLSSGGALSRWTRGRRLAKLTGVFGYATVPPIIQAGTLALARQIYSQALTPGGAAIGDEPTANLPYEAYLAVKWGSRRGWWYA